MADTRASQMPSFVSTWWEFLPDALEDACAATGYPLPTEVHGDPWCPRGSVFVHGPRLICNPLGSEGDEVLVHFSRDAHFRYFVTEDTCEQLAEWPACVVAVGRRRVGGATSR